MSLVLKQTKTITGNTSSAPWTWKQVINEYFETDKSNENYYLTKNQSYVVIQSYIGVNANAGTSYSFGGTATTNITCDNDSRNKSQTWIYQSFWIKPGYWKLIQEENFTVKHNTDGNKKINVSSSLSTTQFAPNSANASGSLDLTFIPRKTEFLEPAHYEWNIGVTGKLTSVSPASPTFTHSLVISFPNYTKYVDGRTGELFDTEVRFPTVYDNETTHMMDLYFTTDNELYSIFTGENLSGKFTLTTYNGEEKLGESFSTIKIYPSPDAKPSITTATLYDLNENTYNLTQDHEKMIAGQSDCKLSLTLSPSNEFDTETTITNLLINGEEYPNPTTNVEKILYNISTDTIKVSMTNSRNIKSESVIKINKWVPYVPVGVDQFNNEYRSYFIRGSTISSSTDHILQNVSVSFSSPFFNGYFGDNETNQNTFTYTWRYKKSTEEIWSEWYTLNTTNTKKENNFINTDNSPIKLKDNNGNDILFEYHTLYDIEYKYKDLLTDHSFLDNIQKGEPVFSWDGFGFRITNSFEVGGVCGDDTIHYYSLPINTKPETITDTSGVIQRVIAKNLTDSSTFMAYNDYTNNYENIGGKFSLDVGTLTAKQNNQWIEPTCWADIIYPVGSIYISVNNTNPSLLFGGKWKSFGEGRTLLGVDTSDGDFNTSNKTGGEKTHKLTIEELPEHNHRTSQTYTAESGQGEYMEVGVTQSARVTTAGNYWYSWTKGSGGNASHNNMPPYITCYMWVRTE